MKFIFNQLADLADHELDDESVLREDLLLLQVQYEEGDIDDDEYAEREAELMVRLRQIKARKRAQAEQVPLDELPAEANVGARRRMVEQALADKSDSYVRDIYEYLREAAIASRSNKPIGDKMIMNAAFLVGRDQAATFDQKVQEIAQRYEGKLSFRYTGPWPPYNFVTIRLQLERSAVV